MGEESKRIVSLFSKRVQTCLLGSTDWNLIVSLQLLSKCVCWKYFRQRCQRASLIWDWAIRDMTCSHVISTEAMTLASICFCPDGSGQAPQARASQLACDRKRTCEAHKRTQETMHFHDWHVRGWVHNMKLEMLPKTLRSRFGAQRP